MRTSNLPSPLTPVVPGAPPAPGAPAVAAPAAVTPIGGNAPTNQATNALGSYDEAGVMIPRPRGKDERLDAYKTSVLNPVADINEAWAKENAKKRESLDAALPKLQQSAAALDNMLKSPGFNESVGNPDWQNTALVNLPFTSGDRKDFLAYHRQFNALQMMNAYQQLRGSGAVTDNEGKKAESAMSILGSTNITPSTFVKAANDYLDVAEAVMNRQRAAAGQEPIKLARPSANPTAQSDVRNQADAILNRGRP